MPRTHRGPTRDINPLPLQNLYWSDPPSEHNGSEKDIRYLKTIMELAVIVEARPADLITLLAEIVLATVIGQPVPS
jgi:hypothetical protein